MLKKIFYITTLFLSILAVYIYITKDNPVRNLEGKLRNRELTRYVKNNNNSEPEEVIKPIYNKYNHSDKSVLTENGLLKITSIKTLKESATILGGEKKDSIVISYMFKPSMDDIKPSDIFNKIVKVSQGEKVLDKAVYFEGAYLPEDIRDQINKSVTLVKSGDEVIVSEGFVFDKDSGSIKIEFADKTIFYRI